MNPNFSKMVEHIILQNPTNIHSETSVKMEGYYIVYKFGFNKNTKCIYMGTSITPNDCLDKINYEGIECRLYDLNVKKTNNVFRDNNIAFNLSLASFLLVGGYTMLFGKNK